MTLSDPNLPEWFKSHGFEEYSDILTNDLGVEAYDDFRLLRNEIDANELLDDMSNLKPMDDTFKQKFKTEIMKIIKGISPPEPKPKPTPNGKPTPKTKPKTKPKPKAKAKPKPKPKAKPKPKPKPNKIKIGSESGSDRSLHSPKRRKSIKIGSESGSDRSVHSPKRRKSIKIGSEPGSDRSVQSPKRRKSIKIGSESRSDRSVHSPKHRKSRTRSPSPKPKRITKSSSAETRPTHQKSHSLAFGKKSRVKQKSSSPPGSPIPKPKSSKKDRHKKTASSFTRSTTHKKLHTKARSNMDTYDIDSIPSNLLLNKQSKKFKKANSTKDFNKKSKHKTSSSLGLFDTKSRRQHKEQMNKTRGGFTVHTNRRVRVDDGRIGIVKYKGRTAFGKSSDDWIGIVIEYGKGQHNGSVNGRSYFRCRDGKGIMIRPDRIIEDLGNPMTKPLDDMMKKGSPEIQALLKEIGKERKEEARKRKQAAMEAAAAKERSNYGGSIGWKPAKFENYKEDQSSGMFKQKLMHPKTLLDKNKDKKADKKKKLSEI